MKIKVRYRWLLYKNYIFDQMLSILSLQQCFTLICAFTLAVWINGNFVGGARELISTLHSIIMAAPIWLALNAILGCINIFKKEKELGQWQNEKFIFSAPQHIFTLNIEPSWNTRHIPFRIKQVPSKSFVSFDISYLGGLGYIKIVPHERQLATFGSRTARYSMRIGKKGKVVALCCIPPYSDDVQCRISILNFEA